MSGLVGRLDLERDASGAIYGTIITAATIVSVAEGVRRVGQIAVTVVVTLLLYAVAHAYSRVLGDGAGTAPSWRGFVRELAEESPMLGACVVPLAVVVAAGLLGAAFDLAVSVGLVAAVAMLFGWGLVAAHRAHQGWLPRLGAGVGFGLLGLAIVALRVTTGH